MWALVVVLVLVVAGLAGAIAVLVTRDDDGTGDDGTVVASDSAEADDVRRESGSEDRPDADDDDAGEDDEPDATTGTAPRLELEQPAPIDAPAPTEGEWIVALRSIDATLPQADIDRAVADARTSVPGARTLISDGFASLRPGYVVVYVGPFPDAPSTWDFCHDLGRTECFGAPLTQNLADVEQRVLPTDPRPG